jgi:putative endonuclease
VISQRLPSLSLRGVPQSGTTKQSKKKIMKLGYIYIMTNHSNSVLYTGVTSDLKKRIWEHKQKFISGFTSKYQIHKLVYYECYEDIQEAILREKKIKGGSRIKKIKLIESINNEWKDLYDSI